MKKLIVGFVGLIAGAPAFAAVPTEASTTVTTLIADATTFVASFWPLAIAVVIGFVFFKLFKKGVGKAT